jgi:peptidoglycan/LPS O-acetylase OafA/YrhL
VTLGSARSRRYGAPAAVAPGQSYSIEIECLRGIAILLVYCFHVDLFVMQRFFTPAGIVSPALAFVRGGYTGVSLFFVISGFLLCGQFLPEIAGGRPVGRPRYALRRALRILPLYYFMIAVGSVLAAPAPIDVLHGLPYLVFLNAFARFAPPIGSFSGVWWSLATEVQFYALLPLIAFLLRPGALRTLALGAGIAYGAAYVTLAAGYPWPTTPESRSVLAHSAFGQGPLFAFGWLAAAIHQRFGARLREAARARRGVADSVLLAALLGIALLLRWTLMVGQFRDLATELVWHVPEGVLWAIVLLLVLTPLRLKPLFQSPPLAWVGTISYALYLVHVPVIAALGGALRSHVPGALSGWSWSAALLVALLTAACAAVAWGLHVVIERPFLRRKARV